MRFLQLELKAKDGSLGDNDTSEWPDGRRRTPEGGI